MTGLPATGDGEAALAFGDMSGAAAADRCGSHRFASVNGVRLHFVEAGDGPLVLLLHGFPELWYAWRRQIPALAAAGLRVVAPDLRGYNLSSKPHAGPQGSCSYGMRAVVEDIRQLIGALGARRASLVGHDWGAGVAWSFAMQHPDVLERLAILNGPHPARLARALLTSPRQLLRSSYMLFFQLPRLPEWVLRRRDYAALFAAFDRLPPEARFNPAERAVYRRAFDQPGALEGGLGYYRALRCLRQALPLRRIDADVLVLWGERDPYLGAELAMPDARWVPRARLERFPDAGHFLQHEKPEVVSAQLAAFLR